MADTGQHVYDFFTNNCADVAHNALVSGAVAASSLIGPVPNLDALALVQAGYSAVNPQDIQAQPAGSSTSAAGTTGGGATPQTSAESASNTGGSSDLFYSSDQGTDPSAEFEYDWAMTH